MSEASEFAEYILRLTKRLTEKAEAMRDSASKPPDELSGTELDEAVARIVKSHHECYPSEYTYDIAWAWACKPPKGHQLIVTTNGLWIKIGDVAHYAVTPLEASRIFIEQHKKDGDK